jgi:hypothetical protein
MKAMGPIHARCPFLSLPWAGMPVWHTLRAPDALVCDASEVFMLACLAALELSWFEAFLFEVWCIALGPLYISWLAHRSVSWCADMCLLCFKHKVYIWLWSLRCIAATVCHCRARHHLSWCVAMLSRVWGLAPF